MERVREKLHSRTGASLLIALLFFLVAMTVGAVVLTAASANAGRIQKNRQEQQNYLAVDSAAELVKEDIVGAEKAIFTAEYQKIFKEIVTSVETTDPVTKETSTHTITTHSTTYKSVDPKIDNCELLTKEICNTMKKIFYSTVPSETTFRAEWDATNKVNWGLDFEASYIPAVKGALTVSHEDNSMTGQRQYGLAVTVGVRPEREEEPPHCATTMSFMPNVVKQEKTDPPTVEVGGNSVTTTYITHYITTVTWEAPVITKGAGA